MDRTVVELDALTDADGAGAQHQHLPFLRAIIRPAGPGGLVLLVVGGVVIGGLGLELGGAGVHHLEGRADAEGLPQGLDLLLLPAGEGGDPRVGEAHLLGPAQGVAVQMSVIQGVLHIHNVLEAVEEPQVVLGDLVDLLRREAPAQRLGHHKEALVVDVRQPLLDIFRVQLVQARHTQGFHRQLQAADGLHQRPFKGVANGHDLAGGLHLGTQGAAGGGELVEGQARDLQHAVVQRGFEAGGRLSGHGVGNLVQRIAQGDLGGHFCDGIAGGLGGQGGGAGHAGIDLDDRILVGIRVQGQLHVAPAFDLQRGDDVQGCGAQHLIFPVGQRLRGGHHDGVAGVHAHGVDVLHGADLDHISGGIPHDLELDLLPAGDAPLDQHLPHPGEVDAPVGDLPQAGLVIGDAASGAAQGVGRADNDRVADGSGKGHRILHALHHVAHHAGLADGFHGVLEALPVLRLADGFGRGAQQPYAVLLQDPLLMQVHGQIQSGLPAQGGQDGVGPLLLDDLFYGGQVQRLDIHMVGNVLVGHDGGGVGVDQHHLHALFLQGAACLGAGVVELSGLANDNGPGAQHQHLLDIRILGHFPSPPPSCPQSGRTGTPYPGVPETPPDETER